MGRGSIVIVNTIHESYPAKTVSCKNRTLQKPYFAKTVLCKNRILQKSCP